jgi:molybdopterin biosynthesis enzyme
MWVCVGACDELILSLSFSQVKVHRKPVVAILSTGNEIVDLQATGDGTSVSDESAHWGGIFDTNRPSLQAALEGLGYTVVDLGIVGDTYVPSRLRICQLTSSH